MNFKSKLERDTWIQNARDEDIICYFKEHKHELLTKARKSMTDSEIAEWCRVMADFNVAGQEYKKVNK